MCHRRRENGRSARDKTENKPRQLVVSIARGVVHWYIKGYLQDPAFEGHWRAGLSTADELVMTHWYYKDEDGLLFFWDTDWRACLCVPCSLVMETLQEHYESTGRPLMQEPLAYTIIWPTDSIGLPCGKMYHSSVVPVTYSRKL